jgi:hypothetical protein
MVDNEKGSLWADKDVSNPEQSSAKNLKTQPVTKLLNTSKAKGLFNEADPTLRGRHRSALRCSAE